MSFLLRVWCFLVALLEKSELEIAEANGSDDRLTEALKLAEEALCAAIPKSSKFFVGICK